MPTILAEAKRIDQAVYDAVTSNDSPRLDAALARLTNAADYSKLWVTSAAVLGALGGPKGRRAAVSGLAGLGVTVVVANLAAKPLSRRRRPERMLAESDVVGSVAMPRSSSFPSGHSAAAFAFPTGVARVWPLAAVPLYGLAAAVAYSRVHTGVHYPGDVLAGSLLGVVLALGTSEALEHWAPNL